MKRAELDFDRQEYQKAMAKAGETLFPILPDLRPHRLSSIVPEFKDDLLHHGYSAIYSSTSPIHAIHIGWIRPNSESNNKFKSVILADGKGAYVEGGRRIYLISCESPSIIEECNNSDLRIFSHIYEIHGPRTVRSSQQMPFNLIESFTAYITDETLLPFFRNSVAEAEQKEKEEILLHKKMLDQRAEAEKKVLASLSKLASVWPR